MVETVLVMPILLTIVFTILVGGLLMTQKYAVTVAAREGARICALQQDVLKAQDAARSVLQTYGLSPSQAILGSCQIDSTRSTPYAVFTVSYRTETIVPAFVFGGTQNQLTLTSTGRFLKER